MIRSRFILITLTVVGVAVAPAAFRGSSVSSPRIGTVTSASPMLEPRSGHTATLLPDGKILITGGMRRNQDFYRSAELYNPATGKFQSTGEMNERRVGQAAVLLRSGKVLIVGGWVGPGCTDSAELYDPATGRFKAIGKMVTRRAHPSATLLPDGNVLVAGGSDHDGRDASLASAEIFDAATLSFRPTGSMSHPRVSHSATLLHDGRVLMVGGRGDKVNAIAEIYDPKTERFTETGSLVTARYKHTAGLLPDGRVLVAGGSDERDWSGNLSSVEIYDPKTGRFITASPLINSRFKLPEQAVALDSGKLLIAGGSKAVEIFDPATGSFAVSSGELSGPWHFMTETRLADGRVLLAGGYANNDQATAQTWIYKP